MGIRVRGNGEGSIFQLATGKWMAQFSTPAGRRSKTFNTQRNARTWLTEQLRDIDTGNFVEPSEITLSTWWDTWVDVYKKRTVSQSSLDTYRYAKNRLSSKLLKKPICDVTTEDIQKELNRLSDKGFSRRTVEMTRTPLQMCFERARKGKKIISNPVTDTTLPEDDHVESVPLSIEEEKKLLAYCLSKPKLCKTGKIDIVDVGRQVNKDILLFIMRTGVRKSEAIFVKWDDWTDMVIRVRGTKNESSDRLVPLPADVVSMLRRRSASRTREYIFTNINGNVLEGRNLLRIMHDLTGHSIHDLRHTYCTRAAQAGVNPKVLQTITGHRKIETLLKVYTHVSDQDREEAVLKISDYCTNLVSRPQNFVNIKKYAIRRSLCQISE
jgi:integrase